MSAFHEARLRRLGQIADATRGFSESNWERYGDSGAYGYPTMSPTQARGAASVALNAGAAQPLPEEAPPEPPKYGQSWVDSLTTGYQTPQISNLFSPVGRQTAFNFNAPPGAGGYVEEPGVQRSTTMSLQPGRFSMRSGPHGNGGGNVHNQLNRDRQAGTSDDAVRKMFWGMLR